MSRCKVHSLASHPLQVLLQNSAARGESFTLCQLRDELLAHADLSDMDATRLYTYVRDQINKMLEAGTVTTKGIESGRQRRKVFQLTNTFPLDMTESHQYIGEDIHDAEPLTVKLSRDSEQLREKVETIHYRLQAYQDIFKKHPKARNEIAPLFELEKAEARALCEKLKVYAELQQRLARSGGDA